jgi:hypothetical protein
MWLPPRPDEAVELAELEVPAARHQRLFVADDKSPVLVMEGGLGSGKTMSALLKVCVLVDRFPGVPGLWVEPTNDLIGSIVLPRVMRWCPEWGIPVEYRRSYRGLPQVLVFYPGSPKETLVFLRSGDRPERIVGFDVGWFIVDEADQQDEEVWERCIGRRRDARIEALGGVRQGIAVFTPEPGINWTYARFHERRTPDMRVIEGISTRANVFNPSGYFDELLSSHRDERERQRVTEGRRFALEGMAFPEFSDATLQPCLAPFAVGRRIQMWCDFNFWQMVWLLVSIDHQGVMHVFDEVVAQGVTTLRHVETAKRHLALRMSLALGHLSESELVRLPTEHWPVTPDHAARRTTCITDAAGSAETTAGAADTDVMRKAGFTVHHEARNPFIRDTLTSVNGALLDGALLFDPATAPYATRCVRNVPITPDGKLEKGEGSKEKVQAGLDHAADAVRYGVWFNRPQFARRGNRQA